MLNLFYLMGRAHKDVAKGLHFLNIWPLFCRSFKPSPGDTYWLSSQTLLGERGPELPPSLLCSLPINVSSYSTIQLDCLGRESFMGSGIIPRGKQLYTIRTWKPERKRFSTPLSRALLIKTASASLLQLVLCYAKSCRKAKLIPFHKQLGH